MTDKHNQKSGSKRVTYKTAKKCSREYRRNKGGQKEVIE
jgi:hypothetical protein